MNNYELEAYNDLRALAIKTNRQIKELSNGCDNDNPIDVDMLKTTKAMFYEQAIEIFKKYSKKSKTNKHKEAN